MFSTLNNKYTHVSVNHRAREKALAEKAKAELADKVKAENAP